MQGKISWIYYSDNTAAVVSNIILRFGSLRHQEVSSGEEGETDGLKKVSDGDTSDDNQLSVTFSDVDDTDSINEISSIKEKIIEEEEEQEETEPVRPAMSKCAVSSVPVFQKATSSETVKCDVTLKPPAVSGTVSAVCGPAVVTKTHTKPLTPAIGSFAELFLAGRFRAIRRMVDSTKKSLTWPSAVASATATGGPAP